jgi:hypothetical protein
MTAPPSTHPAHSHVAARVATREVTSPMPHARGRRRAAPDRRRRSVMTPLMTPMVIRPLITAGSLALTLCAAVWSGPMTSDQAAAHAADTAADTAAVSGPVNAVVVPVAASRPLPPSLSRSPSPSAGDTLTCRDRRGRSSTTSGGGSDGVSIDILFDQASRRDRSSSDRGGGSLVVGCGSDGQLVVLSCAGDGPDNSDNTNRNNRSSDRRRSDRHTDGNGHGNGNGSRDRHSDHSTDRHKPRGHADDAGWRFDDRDSRDLDTRDLQDLIDLSHRTGLNLDELVDLAGDHRDSHTDSNRGSRDGIRVDSPLGSIGVAQNTADLWNLYRASDPDSPARLVRSASDPESDQVQGVRSSRAGVCRQVDR